MKKIIICLWKKISKHI